MFQAVDKVKDKDSTPGHKEFKTLLVEDHVVFRHFIKKSLHKNFPKMLIEEAADGIEALQKVASFAPDLIFMDIRLQGENGLDLTRKIKSNHPHIKVVILTVFDLPEYRQAARQYGVQDFVIKGITPWREVVALVKSISSPSAKIVTPVKSTSSKKGKPI